MERILPTALVMGVIVGLVVAAYMNIFNVSSDRMGPLTSKAKPPPLAAKKTSRNFR